MSNKTRNGARVKTGSAPNQLLSLITSAFFILVGVLSLIFLVISDSKTGSVAPANCEDSSSTSEIFNCNITELEYVVEPRQRELGLSGREHLPENSGMVFVFDQPATRCMWMKDMKFSLDIVWIDDNKSIIKVLKDVRPETFPTSFCTPDTRYVLEVNNGVMDRLGIGVGDSLQL